MKDMKFRHELKYYISYSDYLAIRSRLHAVASLDSHVGEQGTYFIRSLYFDNYNDKALREKIDGVNAREKFRIRYYNYDTSRISLEKKSKLHGMCHKQQTPISKEQCQALIDGNLTVLKESNDVLMFELYTKMNAQCMRPKVIVDYVREPYTYKAGNVRITFDSQIRTGLHSKEFLSPYVPTIGIPETDTIILEVKYDEFLPEVIQMAVQIGCKGQTAFSKYAACRMYG